MRMLWIPAKLRVGRIYISIHIHIHVHIYIHTYANAFGAMGWLWLVAFNDRTDNRKAALTTELPPSLQNCRLHYRTALCNHDRL